MWPDCMRERNNFVYTYRDDRKLKISRAIFKLFFQFFCNTIIIPFESIKKRNEKKKLLRIFFGRNAGGKTLISSILTHAPLELLLSIVCTVTRMARAKLWMFGKLLKSTLFSKESYLDFLHFLPRYFSTEFYPIFLFPGIFPIFKNFS